MVAGMNLRSLDFATQDFLSRVVASSNFMRLSLGNKTTLSETQTTIKPTISGYPTL
jgi:hypothetical protein